MQERQFVRSSSLKEKLNPQKTKKTLEDYETQILKKKKAVFFPNSFLKSFKFVKEKANKCLYSLQTVVFLLNFLLNSSKIQKIGLSKEEICDFKGKIKEIRHLKHPNLINLHHIFEDDHNFYLIFDDLCGGNLKILFETKKKRYFERDSYILFYQLCLITEYLHRKKIIHGKITVFFVKFSFFSFFRFFHFFHFFVFVIFSFFSFFCIFFFFFVFQSNFSFFLFLDEKSLL